MKITLLILCLNEIIGLKEILPKIDKSQFIQILIVDGGSKDGSIEWAKDNGYELYVQKNKGLRHAYFESYDLIKGDTVMTFSPDGNCIAEDIPKILKEMQKGYDMVIASRYLGNIKSEDDDIITAFGNWFFTNTINLLHNGKYTDAMTIFRVFKKDLIKKLDLMKEKKYSIPEKLFFTNISWEPLMSIRAAKLNFNISEVASVEPARIGGERKLQIIRWGLAYLYQVVTEFKVWSKN